MTTFGHEGMCLILCVRNITWHIFILSAYQRTCLLVVLCYTPCSPECLYVSLECPFDKDNVQSVEL